MIRKESLFPPQQALLDQGFKDSRENWVICTPTGSGKTKMAEWALESSFERGFKGAYLAPLKAIVEERLDDWRQKYESIEVGLFTGDTRRAGSGSRPTNESLLLFTPEKFAAYLQNWKSHLTWLSKLDCLVIDELHLLGDSNRGAVIESLIGRLQRINPFVRIIGLSGTLSNSTEISQWLRAKVFVSDWRPVPVNHRITRFKKVSAKPELLLNEVRETADQDGKTLVFVNSRRRSEALAKFLLENGIEADFNHAGLGQSQRSKVSDQMRAGELDALVSTSTLEMGVNFPARKVVIYDAYSFNGDSFTPLTIQRYRQYAGRAGRAGFDTAGESVLMLPVWQGKADKYLYAETEPVRSSLFETQNILREILTEVSSRLAISEQHLEVNFASRTLWRKQDGVRNLNLFVKHLVTAGLIKEQEKKQHIYLSSTPIGRIASQMAISPLSVTLWVEMFDKHDELTEFDLLTIACLCSEATPKLAFNFEEIESISDSILDVKSKLLDQAAEHLMAPGRKINDKRLLSAIKCATITWQHIAGENLEDVAETFDCYPADLRVLQRNLAWVLDAAIRIENVISSSKDENECSDSTQQGKTQNTLKDLKQMVAYGVPREALSLTELKGIGPVRARILLAEGITHVSELTQCDRLKLGKLLKLRPDSVDALLNSISTGHEPPEPDVQISTIATPKTKNRSVILSSIIDPYRLKRALDLQVDHKTPEMMAISGGTEPHKVTFIPGEVNNTEVECDCADFAKGQVNCKHILRAKIEWQDKQVAKLVGQLGSKTNENLRFSLASLWMRAGSQYRSFVTDH